MLSDCILTEIGTVSIRKHVRSAEFRHHFTISVAIFPCRLNHTRFDQDMSKRTGFGQDRAIFVRDFDRYTVAQMNERSPEIRDMFQGG